MPVESRFDVESEIASDAVIRAISKVENTDAIELRSRLYDSVDPSALDAILNYTDGSDVEVQFNFAGHRVTVDDSGKIVIREQGDVHR